MNRKVPVFIFLSLDEIFYNGAFRKRLYLMISTFK